MLRFVTRFNERQEVVANGGALCPEMGAVMRLNPEARQLLVYERAVRELALAMEEHGATEELLASPLLKPTWLRRQARVGTTAHPDEVAGDFRPDVAPSRVNAPSVPEPSCCAAYHGSFPPGSAP
jgi:hypothetical protein